MTGAPLLIAGTGGFARETAELVHACNQIQPRWDLRGFLDDDPATHGRTLGGVTVLGPIDVEAIGTAAVVVCTGSPENYFSRALIVARLGLSDDRYATLVHPTAAIGGSVAIGAGTVIHAQTVMTADVSVGDHVAVMPSVVLTHDDVVEDFVTFGSGARIAGTVTIGRGAYLGAGAMVREHRTIGAWSLVGMGSVVTVDVPPHQRWMGVPARHSSCVEVPTDLLDARPTAIDLLDPPPPRVGQGAP